jgi:hypothetical protein
MINGNKIFNIWLNNTNYPHISYYNFPKNTKEIYVPNIRNYNTIVE